MNVFEIKKEFHALRDLVEDFEVDENGEFIDRSDTVAELLEDIAGTAAEKLENIEYVKREVQAGADMLKAEIDRLMAKKRTLENRVEQLKGLQLTLLHEVDNKCKTDKFSFTVRKSKSVEFAEFVDATMLPTEYQNVKTSIAADKKAIKKAIEKGVEIKGVYLAENETVGVR